MRTYALSAFMVVLSAASNASTIGCNQINWSDRGSTSGITTATDTMDATLAFRIDIQEPPEIRGGCSVYHASDLQFIEATIFFSDPPSRETFGESFVGITVSDVSGSVQANDNTISVRYPPHPQDGAVDIDPSFFGGGNFFGGKLVFLEWSTKRFLDLEYNVTYRISGEHYYTQIPLPASLGLLVPALALLISFPVLSRNGRSKRACTHHPVAQPVRS